MSLQTSKFDANTLGVVETKVLPLAVLDYDFLKQQRIDIQAQKDRDNATRDAELARIDTLIAAADGLGITSKTTTK